MYWATLTTIIPLKISRRLNSSCPRSISSSIKKPIYWTTKHPIKASQISPCASSTRFSKSLLYYITTTQSFSWVRFKSRGNATCSNYSKTSHIWSSSWLKSWGILSKIRRITSMRTSTINPKVSWKSSAKKSINSMSKWTGLIKKA